MIPSVRDPSVRDPSVRVIGITGKIGAGKTTIANYISSRYNYTEYSMANPLKEIGEIFGFTKENLYGTQEQKLQIHPYWKISAREFLQKLGTDIFRNTLPFILPEMCETSSVWCELFKMKVMNSQVSYIVSDIRFLDEAETIKNLGGIIIKVVRNNSVISKTGNELQHASEIEMDNIIPDFTLDNNTLSLEEARKEIDAILTSNVI